MRCMCDAQTEGGKHALLTANVGDARIVLARGGEPLQLTVDHVPDRFGCRCPLAEWDWAATLLL